MKYRSTVNAGPLSILGFGCMRFPKKRGKIDIAKTEQLVRRAVSSGINYFDAAYTYPGIEEALGIVMERIGCRSRVNIATKLPHYLLRSEADLDKFFETELLRLKTDHIDYYLIHMLPDVAVWDNLKSYGIEEWIERRKNDGSIGRIGFSYHGSSNVFCEVLDCYDWDFCQIQYNYMDENTQAGRKGLQRAAAKGIPVIIMEPLRGGRLVNDLPPKALRAFRSYAPNISPAEWSFRWLYSQPEVTCVLSGMNEMSQLEENIRIASSAEAGELSDIDLEFLEGIINILNEKIKIPCTGCGYCMPCPNGVDIPGCFNAYNIGHTSGYFTGNKTYAVCSLLRKEKSGADKCVRCGSCLTKCPQGIDIPSELAKVNRYYNTILHKPIYKMIYRMFKFYSE